MQENTSARFAVQTAICRILWSKKSAQIFAINVKVSRFQYAAAKRYSRVKHFANNFSLSASAFLSFIVRNFPSLKEAFVKWFKFVYSY